VAAEKATVTPLIFYSINPFFYSFISKVKLQPFVYIPISPPPPLMRLKIV